MTKVKVIKLKDARPDEEIDPLEAEFIGVEHFDTLVDYDCDVYKPDGTPLLMYRNDVLSDAVCKLAYKPLREAGKNAHGNRGAAAGKPEEMKIHNRKAVKASPNAKVRIRPIKLDGTVSNTSYAKEAPSNVVGFMDRYARFPYCRTTAFTMNKPELFGKIMPYIKEVDQVFADLCPERYAAQKAFVDRTSKDFIIPSTVFTTVTVNYNFRTAAHRDAGDLKEGFGVMSVLRAGHYAGGYLIFPKYRVAVDMRTRGVILADVHELHGNSPIVGIKSTYERISTVMYYRQNMIECGSAEEEMDRAKRRKKGDPLKGKIEED